MKNIILPFFPQLTPSQQERLEALPALYTSWNAAINVISRKDIGNLMLHHVLHSLAIARLITFAPGTRILDAGTGGGFPGIPLAILNPQAHFTLVDSIGKKIRVVSEILQALELTNVTPLATRFESIPEKFDFVTGRAVSGLPDFLRMTREKIRHKGFNELPNGILYLSGGVPAEGFVLPGFKLKEYALSDWFGDPWFASKKLFHLVPC